MGKYLVKSYRGRVFVEDFFVGKNLVKNFRGETIVEESGGGGEF